MLEVIDYAIIASITVLTLVISLNVLNRIIIPKVFAEIPKAIETFFSTISQKVNASKAGSMGGEARLEKRVEGELLEQIVGQAAGDYAPVALGFLKTMGIKDLRTGLALMNVINKFMGSSTPGQGLNLGALINPGGNSPQLPFLNPEQGKKINTSPPMIS